MQLLLSHVLAGLAILVSSVDMASAVDLRQYSAQHCNGNRRICPGVNSNTCCKASGTFVSGSTTALPAGAGHRVWDQGFADAPFPACGYKAGVKIGSVCISLPDGELGWTGHSWHHARSSRAAEGAIEDQCKESVEPSIYVISGRWFEINDTVSADVKQVLFDTWELDTDESARSRLPAELDVLETDWRPEDEDE